MKTLYVNPAAAGVAGDMFTAALLELLEDTAEFFTRLRSLPLPAGEWGVAHESVTRHGIAAGRYAVTVGHGDHEADHGHGHGHATVMGGT